MTVFRRVRVRGRRVAGVGAPSRPGFALFLALGALVIISVLVAASSFVSMQEARLGQNSLIQAKAFAMAEYGLNKIQQDWEKTRNLKMASGERDPIDTKEYYEYDLAGQGTCKVHYLRLNNETFWIVSEGRASIGTTGREAVKRVGAILRLRIPTIETKGAVMVNGNVKASGSKVIINGNNTNPGPWSSDCTGSTGPNLAGVTLPTEYALTTNGNPNISGNPASQELPEAGLLESYVSYGDETWNSLAEEAITLNGGDFTANPLPVENPDGTCNKSVTSNWGEPWRSGAGYMDGCINYFPIIRFTSSVKLKGNGRGQGILLVEGDLEFVGGFEFYGVVIVKNQLLKAKGNAKIYGSIMAAGADVEDGDPDILDPDNLLGGSFEVHYSKCALDRATKGSASVSQAKERAWTELY